MAVQASELERSIFFSFLGLQIHNIGFDNFGAPTKII